MTSKLSSSLVGALLFTVLVAAAQNPTPLVTQTEDQLIAVLQSGAGPKEKADACRELAVVGGRQAIAPLAALLADEKLSHMARYALETLREPAVDRALRGTLGQLKGRPLVGVIGSLGVRRDTQAIEPLTKFLTDPDADVAQAAARALGKIGTAAAAKAIEAALPQAPAGNQVAFCEGLFRCAEALLAQDQRREAVRVFDRLRGLEAPHQIRAGALRGAILARQEAGVRLLQEHLRSPDYVLFAAAVRTAMELTDRTVTKALVAELNQPVADRQVLLIQTLGKRGDAEALPALFAAARSGPQAVRLAAIRALPEIGQISAVSVLTQLMTDGDGEIARAAQESLAGLAGQDVDATVLSMLASNEAAKRLTAIDLIGRRRLSGALPALVKAAEDTAPEVSASALKRLGELGGPAQLGAVVELTLRLKQNLDAAEQALKAICGKAGAGDECADRLIGALASAQPAPKAALLRALSAVGGPKALQAVRRAVDDSNPDVHAAALRALGSWKTADAGPELLALARSASDPTDKMLCVRSVLDLAGTPEWPAEQRLGMCREAAGLIQRAEEKKLLLAALGGIPALGAIDLILPHLEDGATKEEASAAVLSVAAELLKGGQAAAAAPKLLEPLTKVSQATGNANVAGRAKRLLEQAQNKAAGK